MEHNSICASYFLQNFEFSKVVSFFLSQTKVIRDPLAYKYLKLFCQVSETFLELLKANFLQDIKLIMITFECD